MRIALIGYGKMGKAIEKQALKNNHEIAVIIDNEDDWEQKKELLSSADVAIEFSTPDAVLQNLRHCFEMKIPVVCGTTAWHDKLEEIKKECEEKNASLLYASNFSIGVNLFFQFNKQITEIMRQFDNYDVSMKEIHHTEKLDSPSGTAVKLANDIIQLHPNKKEWTEAKTKNADNLHIKCKRKGNTVGTHYVKWSSPIDNITIKHKAKSRDGFVLGALLASEFIIGKKGVFTMEDVLFKKKY